jgi:hypothetical protein
VRLFFIPLLFIGLFLTSCMSQDPTLLKIRASDLLQSAEKINAKDPRTVRAAESLRQGELQMMHSDYNHARYFFKESIRDSTDVVEGHTLPDEKVAALIVKKEVPEKSGVEDSSKKPSPAPSSTPTVIRDALFHGSIPFEKNQEQSYARQDLDRALKIMLENPKSFLVMSGDLGEQEDVTLATKRFRLVGTFFVKQGVARERLRIPDTVTRHPLPQIHLEVHVATTELNRSQ